MITLTIQRVRETPWLDELTEEEVEQAIQQCEELLAKLRAKQNKELRDASI